MLPNEPFDTFVHTRLNLLLIIYCAESIVSYGKQISKYLSRWAFSFSYFFSMSYFFLFLFVLDTFAANQLSDIPFEARQAASVSEMLRLISCHKPNDKTYFSDLLPLSTKSLVVVVVVAPSVIIVIMFIYGIAREKKN